MAHIVGYHDRKEHIGQWQRYLRDRRWEDLAENFTQDIQQLKIINGTRSNNGRGCKLMKTSKTAVHNGSKGSTEHKLRIGEAGVVWKVDMWNGRFSDWMK